MQYITDELLIGFFKENEDLNNHDLTLKYKLIFCKNPYEKQIITRIHNESFSDNTIIRYRNNLIKEGIINEYSTERHKKHKKLTEYYSPINRVLQGISNWFKGN